MGNDIIDGTGDWSFGMARWVYEPLISQLEESGYRINEDLFICYYDWRQKNHYIVDTYLKPMLDRVKEKFPDNKVDFICHSMGGIVARTYIQGRNYQDDVDKLIMIATPNKGSVDAYYLWSTGRLKPKRGGNHFYNLIVRGYLWILLKLMDVSFGTEGLEEIQETFPSIGELIPSLDYGPILCYEDGNGSWRTVPLYYMRYKNYLLDHLNETLHLLPYKVNYTCCIIGHNFSTSEYIMIDKERLFNGYEEIILDVVETLEGDGTVTVKSGELEGFHDQYLEFNHRDIVKHAYSCIEEIYGLETKDKQQDEGGVEETTLHILLTGSANIVVIQEGQRIMELQNQQLTTLYPHLHEKYPNNHQWILLKDVPKGSYQMKLHNEEGKKIHMTVMAKDLKKLQEEMEIKAHQQNYTIKFEIT